MPATAETALIVPIPGAEPLVSAWREQYDPSAAAGIPAHITLLYPFLPPPRLDAAVRRTLRALFAAHSRVSLQLTAVGQFPELVYLAPEPDAPFIALTQRLVAEWPEAPPYGGKYDTIVPHVTVANTRDAAIVAEVAAALAKGVPLTVSAAEAWLVQREGNGRWRMSERFPFTD